MALPLSQDTGLDSSLQRNSFLRLSDTHTGAILKDTIDLYDWSYFSDVVSEILDLDPDFFVHIEDDYSHYFAFHNSARPTYHYEDGLPLEPNSADALIFAYKFIAIRCKDSRQDLSSLSELIITHYSQIDYDFEYWTGRDLTDEEEASMKETDRLREEVILTAYEILAHIQTLPRV